MKLDTGFHQTLATLRKDLILSIQIDSEFLNGQASFSQCLLYAQSEENRFRSFVRACPFNNEAMDYTQSIVSCRGFPAEEFLRNNTKFLKCFRNTAVEADKVYIEFCKQYSRTLEIFLNDILNDTSSNRHHFFNSVI